MAVMIKSVGSNGIQAIKLYRDVMGAGLKEAKDAIDSISPDNPLVLENVYDEKGVVQAFRNAGGDAVIISTEGKFFTGNAPKNEETDASTKAKAPAREISTGNALRDAIFKRFGK
jgi:hypothetical protein